MTPFASVALLSALLMIGAQAAAQNLVPSPPLAPEIEALPRLTADGAVASQINALLDQRDARDFDLLNCYHDTRSDDPARSIEVLADGPEFLSFVIAMGTYCEGAAHPWWYQEILNIDLATGEETDLRAFLPTAPDGEPNDMLAVVFLNTVDDLTGDCMATYARAFRDGHLHFDLGVVEAENALMLWPSGLAYVETPCLDAAYVPLTYLQEAGFHGKLIRALLPSP